MELETIFNAIFDAEETYNAENISVVLNEKLLVMCNDKVLNSFDIKNLDDSDIEKINGLCNYLSLKFKN